ncbi:hypothetical protein JHN52_22075 [Streptomyces sp. MBT97]|uniref:hypothetical protein n=1 Tax=Streptomyces sp. MBT97 TaxID=2800411 RepID=UPI00190C2F5D|nr:hypothetical protein [Streptomyces sp. MBT97]MBK3635563.1 hypothetical protein [Streptomyces sp. MBT97]
MGNNMNYSADVSEDIKKSVLKRRGAAALVTALLAAGTLAGPTVVEAVSAPSHAPGSAALLPTDVVINRDVTFRGGVPVGGWYSLSIFPSGAYNYSGHMHDSGWPSYNFAGACVVRFANGTAFVFETAGRMHGTGESGSRDYNWNRSATRHSIRDAYQASGGGWNARCTSKVNADLNALVNSTIQGVGYVTQVIAILA